MVGAGDRRRRCCGAAGAGGAQCALVAPRCCCGCGNGDGGGPDCARVSGCVCARPRSAYLSSEAAAAEAVPLVYLQGAQQLCF
jgi:hypothetical protein